MKSKLIIGFLLISSILCAQIKKNVHEISNYNKILKDENSRVKMEVFDKETVKSSQSYNLNDLKIPENKKVNIVYGSKVSEVKEAQVPKPLITTYPSGDFRAIPEILFSKVKGSEDIVSYRIFFTSSIPFEYDHDKDLFEGGLGFVLVNALDNLVVSELEDPVYVEVVSTEIEEIAPKKLEINHLSLPSSEISMSQKDGVDSLKIKIITNSNLEGYETYVPIRPTLNLSVQETSIMAFGVEKTQLNVALKGSSTADSVEVSFSTDKIIPSKFKIAANETKQVELRSGNSLGKINIKASGRGLKAQEYVSNTLEIRFVFPWLFILIAAIGGLLGHIARNRKSTEWQYSYLGMIDGLLAAIFFFFLNLVIPGIGELPFLGVWIFGIAALGGYLRLSGLFPFIRNLTTPPDA